MGVSFLANNLVQYFSSGRGEERRNMWQVTVRHVLTLFALGLAITMAFHDLPTIDVVRVQVDRAFVSMASLADSGEQFNSQYLQKIGEGQLIGPESFVEDPRDKNFYFAGTADGKIIRVSKMNDSVSVFSHVGGRPLGIHAVNSDRFGKTRIIVAEAVKGLLSIEEDGSIHILSNYANGRAIQYANDLDIDNENGIIYFSDCSQIPPLYDKKTRLWSTMKAALFDIFSGYPTGRLLKYDFNTKETTELISDIAYANGVALSKDKSFVLVAETARYTIRRYWLTGEKSGTWDYFIGSLPMLPDGVSRDEMGHFWVAGFIRSPVVDWLHDFPTIKKLLLRVLLDKIGMVKKSYGIVLEVDEGGNIVRSIHDNTGLISDISSVSKQPDNTILLGGLERPFLALYTLPRKKQ